MNTVQASSETLPIALAALYLRGAPRAVGVRRGAWAAVLRSLRIADPSLERAAAALRGAGHWAEALAIEEPGLLSWAEERWRRRELLTAACSAYPSRWLSVLGAGAPPALWIRGEVPEGDLLSIVGSRQVPASVRAFCGEVSQEAARLGFGVVSGGAEGCDRAAARACPPARLLEILPCGFGLRRQGAGCQLSVCAPDEEFSSGTAMERNALIYSAGDFSVVGQARFRQGGTWTGAIEAHRRGLTRLMVRERPDDAACRALVALGAIPLRDPAGLAVAMAEPPQQAGLFGSHVRERRARYCAA